MAAEYSPELSAQDIQNTQPVPTRAWDFNAQFDKIFSDEASKRAINLRRAKTPKRYARVSPLKVG